MILERPWRACSKRTRRPVSPAPRCCRACPAILAPRASGPSHPRGGPLKTFNVYSTGLSASYQVDFWGRNRDLRNAALAAAKASRFDRETVVLTVMTSVAMSYFEVLEFHDRLQVAEQNLENAQTILRDLEFEANVGTATALDVAQQATTVATVNATIPPLRQQLRQSVDALAILIGAASRATRSRRWRVSMH